MSKNGAHSSSHLAVAACLVLAATAVLCQPAVALRVSELSRLLTAADGCAAARRPDECLTTPGCEWCCEDAVRSPCYLPIGPALVAEAATATVGVTSIAGEGGVLYLLADHVQRISCPAFAALRQPAAAAGTCNSRCYSSNATCEDCELKNWCVFCSSWGTCQPPGDTCNDNSVMQQCAAPPDPDDGGESLLVWKSILSVSVGILIGAVLMIIGAVLYNRRRHERQRLEQLEARRRRREQRQQRRVQEALQREQMLAGTEPATAEQEATATATATVGEAAADPEVHQAVEEEEEGDFEGQERRPLLQPRDEEREEDDEEEERLLRGVDPRAFDASHISTRASTASHEDESICYLCLDARSTVTFLPCYHTCCCEACSNRLRPRANEIDCPFCRTKIEAMVSLGRILLPDDGNSP